MSQLGGPSPHVRQYHSSHLITRAHRDRHEQKSCHHGPTRPRPPLCLQSEIATVDQRHALHSAAMYIFGEV